MEVILNLVIGIHFHFSPEKPYPYMGTTRDSEASLFMGVAQAIF